MRKLLIATNNQGKINEIKKLLSELDFQVVYPQEVGVDASFDPDETGTTFAQNAEIKARAYAKETGCMTLADDSGLIVDALEGRPGVYSKRYGSSDEERNAKLLREMEQIPENKRTARFVSSICVYDPETDETLFTQGVVEGLISEQARGDQGFGYDPVFIPKEIEGNHTFAELGVDKKNKISHRARALKQIRRKLLIR